MKSLWLIDTNRLDNELTAHRIELRNKEIEVFKAKLAAFKEINIMAISLRKQGGQYIINQAGKPILSLAFSPMPLQLAEP